jgi:FkbM family methyltransferase
VLSLQSFVVASRKIVPRGWSPVLQLLSRRLAGLQNYPVTVDGEFELRLDLRERMCHEYFYSSRCNEPTTVEIMRKALRHGDVFIDVGANIGFFSRVASEFVGLSGSVLAVEPAPAAHRILEANTRLLKNVSRYRCALGAEQGQRDFFVRNEGDLSSFERSLDSSEVRVAVRTLDDIAPRNVRFIKIDVEGFEIDVLRGSARVLTDCRPFVYFEHLKKHVHISSMAFADFQRFFNSFGYECRWTTESPAEGLLSSSAGKYILASPRETGFNIFE